MKRYSLPLESQLFAFNVHLCRILPSSVHSPFMKVLVVFYVLGTGNTEGNKTKSRFLFSYNLKATGRHYKTLNVTRYLESYLVHRYSSLLYEEEM